MEEYLKTHSITYTEEETKLYESGLEYSQPDYIFEGRGCIIRTLSKLAQEHSPDAL